MTVNSWLLSVVRLVARIYIWLLAAVALVYLVITVAGLGLFNDPPTSYVVDVGLDHPALAPGVRMLADSPLAVGRDAPVVGTLVGHLEQIVVAGYPALVAWLALRVLDLARSAGPFAEAMPRRLHTLGWALVVGQPLAAVAQSLCTAYLRSHLLVDTPFADALSLAIAQTVSWPTILTGVGILVFRSIVVEGVGMRRDLEGTV